MSSIWKKLAASFILVAGTGGCLPLLCLAQQSIPIDPAVRYGKLSNGLTYYIRHNEEPKHRAVLWLVNKVGSVLETDDQRGLAHFMEHMNFNGTAHFPKNTLVDYLEKIGLRFGADINAYTSFDETVYKLPIPTDDPEIVRNGVFVIHEWAQFATLDSTEIDNERGVVLEEKRLGLGAGERMSRIIYPMVFNHSRYAERIPIGIDEVLHNFKPEAIRRFHRDWYRPDLQAVIIVGDIDVDQMEKMIKEQFADLKNPVNERERTKYSVPVTSENQFVALTDREQSSTEVQVMIGHKANTFKTEEDYRQYILRTLCNHMLLDRYNDLAFQPQHSFFRCNASIEEVGGGLEAYNMSLVAKPGLLQEGFKQMWRETDRVKRFGFTQEELERAKKAYLGAIEQSIGEKGKTHSEEFVEEYKDNFLNGVPSPGIDGEYALVKKFLPGISLADVNAMTQGYIQPTGRDIILQGPEKDKAKLPDEATVNAWIQEVEKEDLKPYVAKSNPLPLLKQEPVPGKIVLEKQDIALHVTELVLSNGVKVVLKPTDFQNDQILFNAFSHGGLSVASDADYMSARWANGFVQSSGVGNYSFIDLQQNFLVGKQMIVQPSISLYEQGVEGVSTAKDLESALQLVYAYFTEPRLDAAICQGQLADSRARLKTPQTNPRGIFEDTVNSVLGNHNFRFAANTLKNLDQVDMNKAYQFYKDRFSDAAGFTFSFVGSIDMETIKPLLEKYLGSLPATHRGEKSRDLGVRRPTGIVKKTVHKGTEPVATVKMYYSGSFDFSLTNRIKFDALVASMQLRLIDRLREEAGGVYAPRVGIQLSRFPGKEYSFVIEFTCAPENVEKLKAMTREELKKIRTNGPIADDLSKWKIEDKRAREVRLQSNEFWGMYLNQQLQNDMDLHDYQLHEGIVEGITAEDIKQFATFYLNGINYYEFELLPVSSK